jgi:uncharacterized membrane protein
MRISAGLWMVLVPIASVLLGIRLTASYVYSVIGFPEHFIPEYDPPIILVLGILLLAIIHPRLRPTRREALGLTIWGLILGGLAALIVYTIYGAILG